MTKAHIIVYNVNSIQTSYINNLIKNIKRITKKPVYVIPHQSSTWAKPIYIIPVNMEKG